MSTGLIIIGCLILIAIVVVQIGKVTELAAKIRGEEEVQFESNKRGGILMMVFLVLFLIFCIWSAWHYKNWMLGYGPHFSASEHGGELDAMFNVTLFFTGIVFIVTHIALFWFAYKYRGRKGAMSTFISHDNKLEIIWTAIPAIVMCFLVIRGLVAWNEVMADIDEGEEYVEIEATGQQFLWHLRYPGPDGKLGTRNFRLIKVGENPLGQDWTDDKNLDDLHPTEIVLPVNKKVRVRIMAMDVLHNFDLPHFRVKMDAVPGMPTYFVFTPTKTTDEYRQELRKYPEYQQPSDKNDPNSDPLWKTFNYELACAELCGKGHFSMKKIVRIVSEEEYNAWLKEQKSYYLLNVRGKEFDPRKGELLSIETEQLKQDFNLAVEKALSATTPEEKVIGLDYVDFEEGTANLTSVSSNQLENLVAVMNKYPKMTIELGNYTYISDSTANSLSLTQDRAATVSKYLINKGIDPTRLLTKGHGQVLQDTTSSKEAMTRTTRTEIRILTQ